MPLDEYVTLGNSGVKVSRLCLGGIGYDGGSADRGLLPESKQVFDEYVAAGGNFFDTANWYGDGQSERSLGEWVAPLRSHAVVATKYSIVTPGGGYSNKLVRSANVGGNSRKSLVESLDGSLKRLGMGHVDLLYLHIWDNRTPAAEVMRSLDDVVRSGKSLYVGISDTPAWVISRCNAIADLRGWSPFVALQTRYNLLDRSMESDLQPMANQLGIGTTCWGIMAEGFLGGHWSRDVKDTRTDSATAEKKTRSRKFEIKRNVRQAGEQSWAVLDAVRQVAGEVGRPPAQVSVRWMMQKGITAPVAGARTVAQLRDHLAATEFALSDAQMAALDAASKPRHPFPGPPPVDWPPRGRRGRLDQTDGGFRIAPNPWQSSAPRYRQAAL